MRIILNAAPLRGSLTGIGNYTLNLALGLERSPDIGGVHYFNRFTFSDDRPAVGVGKNHQRLPLIVTAYRTLRDASFRLQSGGIHADLYHETNFILMPFEGPSVATIHDLSYLHYPQFHPKDRVRRMERGMPETLKRGSHLIAVSEFVRQEIIQIFGVSPEKVSAVHNGVDPVFRPRPRAECETVLSRHGLSGSEYLLAVGTLEPRKNILGLIAAYDLLPKQIQERFPLVLAGMKGWLSGPLEKKIHSLESRGRLRPLGYVSAPDLPFLYSAASAAAYPSFYEGFGLPALEAMASGVPLMSSNRSSLPEVVGEAALQADPENIEAMAAGLLRLLTDDDFRSTSRIIGPTRAKEFSWEKCVARTIEIYRAAISG